MDWSKLSSKSFSTVISLWSQNFWVFNSTYRRRSWKMMTAAASFFRSWLLTPTSSLWKLGRFTPLDWKLSVSEFWPRRWIISTSFPTPYTSPVYSLNFTQFANYVGRLFHIRCRKFRPRYLSVLLRNLLFHCADPCLDWWRSVWPLVSFMFNLKNFAFESLMLNPD